MRFFDLRTGFIKNFEETSKRSSLNGHPELHKVDSVKFR